jgi:hypothetical protein
MASPPAPPSPSSSQASLPEPTLEILVEHFLASKRSLAAIQHVARAQEIVVSGREALEENAVLAAKNGFVKKALEKEVRKLEALGVGMSLLESDVGSGFEVRKFSRRISGGSRADHRYDQSTLTASLIVHSQDSRRLRRQTEEDTAYTSIDTGPSLLPSSRRAAEATLRLHR